MIAPVFFPIGSTKSHWSPIDRWRAGGETLASRRGAAPASKSLI